MKATTLFISLFFTTTLPIMADGGVSNTAIAWQQFVNRSPDNVLLDFSFAGYKHGEVAPADVYTLGYTVYDVTKYGLDGTDDFSDRAAFDRLVDEINNKARKMAAKPTPSSISRQDDTSCTPARTTSQTKPGSWPPRPSISSRATLLSKARAVTKPNW